MITMSKVATNSAHFSVYKYSVNAVIDESNIHECTIHEKVIEDIKHIGYYRLEFHDEIINELFDVKARIWQMFNGTFIDSTDENFHIGYCYDSLEIRQLSDLGYVEYDAESDRLIRSSSGIRVGFDAFGIKVQLNNLTSCQPEELFSAIKGYVTLPKSQTIMSDFMIMKYNIGVDARSTYVIQFRLYVGLHCEPTTLCYNSKNLLAFTKDLNEIIDRLHQVELYTTHDGKTIKGLFTTEYECYAIIESKYKLSRSDKHSKFNGLIADYVFRGTKKELNLISKSKSAAKV